MKTKETKYLKKAPKTKSQTKQPRVINTESAPSARKLYKQGCGCGGSRRA
ncbi:hypothetical protein ACQCVK_12065 [Rossellomorea vietnamensis]|nr:hypothetical protein [Rossellomorea aquimaris]